MSCEVMLRTSDGEIVAADRNAIRHSQLIDGILEDLPKAGDANSASAEPIPLAEVDAKTLKKVLEWCEHHKDDDQLTQKSNTEDEMYVEDIPEWDEQYFKMDDQMLFSVLLASNFMNVRLLMEMACKTIAEKMKGRTAEELRTMFQVENDLTEEDLRRHTVIIATKNSIAFLLMVVAVCHKVLGTCGLCLIVVLSQIFGMVPISLSWSKSPVYADGSWDKRG
ncbi:unnamed protein product [Toxocara canis]|uniref:Skp1-related protein n=1 Tax=Toxocara canis TaxID=6265 RepID=A0A183UKX7_TOXCA|nr:unnamed protein product [Toxocara canis]